MIYVEVAVKSPLTKSFTYSHPKELARGLRVTVPFGSREVMAVVLGCFSQKPEGDFSVKPILKVIDEEPLLTEDLLLLANRVADYNFCALSEVLFTMIPFKAKKFFELSSVMPIEQEEHNFTLTDEQQRAVTALQQAKANKICYLFGVTGSGKTAVLMQVIEQTLNNGGDVIYLVPEISLANQIYKTLVNRFKGAKLIHSALTDKQRLSTWRFLQTGKGHLVVGTRSAIFAPVTHLQLIIIDEEHDSSYKSMESPRFHARQVAMMRSSQHKAKLILASATPSVESYYALQTGLFLRVNLLNRALGVALPPFRIVDMRREKGLFGQFLVNEVIKTKAMGRQSLLFLNRKGFAKYYTCPDCGFQLHCPQCSVALTYHKKQAKLICHYCGAQEEPPLACPQCHSKNAGYSVYGLEKVKEEAERLFGHLKLLYLDGDTVKTKAEAEQIINQFSKGEADILLATQVVAKGFNFKNLRLVAMVSADVGLALPDFRAEEKTFALLMQIAGRTGRYHSDGLVVAQTYRPANKAIYLASQADTEGFYQYELAMRKASGFPPFCRLIKVAFRSKNEQKALQYATNFAKAIQNILPNDEVLGPAPSPLQKLGGVYRYQVILRTQTYQHLKEQLTSYLAENPVASPVYREVDSDPVSLL